MRVNAHTIVNRTKARHGMVSAALSAAGIKGPVEFARGEEIEQRVRSALAGGAKLVVIGGGDGSIGAAAGALAGSDAALGLLPLGTFNHLARDLGISDDLDEAAATIAAGHVRRIDVAELNGRVFVNNSAIGLYPLMVVDRASQQRRLGRSKRLAMIVASFRTLVRFHDQRLMLSGDGGATVIDTPMLFVGNNDYRLAFPASGQREVLDDGKLCVLVMRKKNVPGFLAATFRALIGAAREDDMVRMEAVEHLRVDSHRSSLTVSIDGETFRISPPLDYRIRPGALRVVAPAGRKEVDH